jgi:hypothetical protein
MSRKVRSVTLVPGQTMPAWAAYVVTIASVREWRDGIQCPDQAFGSRSAAESWARQAASLIPADTDDVTGAPQWWILVYALPPRSYAAGGRPAYGAGGALTRGQCYLALDPGARPSKPRQPIWPGYGNAASA